MGGSKRDGKVPGCDVGYIPGEVYGEAAARALAFLIVAETQAHRVIEVEVACDQGGPAREEEKCDWKHFEFKRQASFKVESVCGTKTGRRGIYTRRERAVAR